MLAKQLCGDAITKLNAVGAMRARRVRGCARCACLVIRMAVLSTGGEQRSSHR